MASGSSSEREARIAELRRQIAAGTYETPGRLEAAVDILLERLRSDKSEKIAPRRGEFLS